MVPSALYVLQNNLVLVAANNLEGPILAVTAQVKILTTAFFTVIILKRSLRRSQWAALAFLFVGVAMVQVSQMNIVIEMGDTEQRSEGGDADADASSVSNAGESGGDGGTKNMMLGLTAEISACMTSGFAGVYFEKVLKGSTMYVACICTRGQILR